MPQELKTPIQYIKGVGPGFPRFSKRKHRTWRMPFISPPRLRGPPLYKKNLAADCCKHRTAVAPVLSSDIRSITAAPAVHRHDRRRDGNPERQVVQLNPRFMKGRYRKGMKSSCPGNPDFQFQKEIHHPELEILEDPGEKAKERSPIQRPGGILHFQRIVPIYSETEGLYQRQR